METLLGIAMFYAWIHSTVIISKKTKNLTSYETGVLIAGGAAFVLFLMGSL